MSHNTNYMLCTHNLTYSMINELITEKKRKICITSTHKSIIFSYVHVNFSCMIQVTFLLFDSDDVDGYYNTEY